MAVESGGTYTLDHRPASQPLKTTFFSHVPFPSLLAILRVETHLVQAGMMAAAAHLISFSSRSLLLLPLEYAAIQCTWHFINLSSPAKDAYYNVYLSEERRQSKEKKEKSETEVSSHAY